MTAQIRIDYGGLTDLELAGLIVRRDAVAVRLVTQRYNQRLFRTAWSILRSRPEAEDAVQSAYLQAFAAIAGFKGEASLSTWLTRIVINQALGQKRSAARRKASHDDGSVVFLDSYREKLMRGSTAALSPEAAIAREQLRQVLEDAVGRLPAVYRLVFVLREVEGLSVEEAAETLGIPAATVKTRHLRARRRLQQELDPELKSALTGVFPFAGVDCQALSDRVLAQFCGPNSLITGPHEK